MKTLDYLQAKYPDMPKETIKKLAIIEQALATKEQQLKEVGHGRSSNN